MRTLVQLYGKSKWHAVFNFQDETARGRIYLLLQSIVSAVIGGFTGGIFYTGYLMEYDIDIVQIAILNLIPHAVTVWLLFVPYILERFTKRRKFLTITRILYYAFQILGVSLLPLVVKDPTGRVVGLVVIIFIASILGALKNGYSPWHMPYITDDIRMDYFTAITVVGQATSAIVVLVTSFVTDYLADQNQLALISILRYVAFGLAILDVYLMQKPKEPIYQRTASKPKLLDVLRMPLTNKRFMLMVIILCAYSFLVSMFGAVESAWYLSTVDTGYFYLNFLNSIYPIFVLLTSGFWTKVMKRLGTFPAYSLNLLLYAPTFAAVAFVNHGNFLWLLTIIRLVQNCLGMLDTYCSGNFLYICMPPTDQTNYVSFYRVFTSLTCVAGSAVGAGFVAWRGDQIMNLLGCQMDSVQTLFLVSGTLVAVLALVVRLLCKHLPDDRQAMAEAK